LTSSSQARGTVSRAPSRSQAVGGESKLRKEAHFFAKLGGHPRIVKLHGYVSASAGKPAALVMELATRGTLYALVAKGQEMPGC